MSMPLRVEMILLAVLVVGIIVRFVNSQRLRVQYSFVWLLIALALLTAAFFPGVVFRLCALLGMEQPSNLVYLAGIITLLLITFYQTVLISKLSDRVTRLTQLVSLEKFLLEQNHIPSGPEYMRNQPPSGHSGQNQPPSSGHSGQNQTPSGQDSRQNQTPPSGHSGQNQTPSEREDLQENQ